jgi:AraC-like DNA-binding protein
MIAAKPRRGHGGRGQKLVRFGILRPMAPDAAEAVRVRFRFAEPAAYGRITQAGLIRDSAGASGQQPYRVLDSYALVYSLDGACRFTDANGFAADLVPGDALLLFPDLPHRYGPPPGVRWSEFYLVFDGPVFDLMRERGILNPARPILHVEPVHVWLARMESVTDVPRRPGASVREAARLQLLLADMLDAARRTPAEEGNRRLIERACAMLESDLSREMDLPDLARRLGTSYESFRKRFVRATGMPPARWRTVRMIERACELMQRGGLSDKQIADRLGFNDEFHFSRRFKSVLGLSPRAFRRTLSRPRV